MATTKKNTTKASTTAKATTAKAKAKEEKMEVRTLKSEMARMSALDASRTDNDKAFAEILNNIAECELYKEEGADSMKDWFERVHKGDVFGIKYSMARQLIKAHKYVWSHAEYSEYRVALARPLASAVKKDKAKVDALIKAKKIQPSMARETLLNVLAKEGLSNGKVVTTQKADVSDSIKLLDAFFATLEKKNGEKMDAYISAWKACKAVMEK